MCGIAGIWNRNSRSPVDPALLDRMVTALGHRGPDDHGVYRASNVGLCHTRLSIIDMLAGHQPMHNADGSLWIVFNGEIYNHIELREEMACKGRTFKTRCDTEVVLQMYEEIGAQCVDQFNGQFAFAIWDEKRQTLFCARDRVGVRPLFYTLHEGRFLFGSEIKAIFEDSRIPREIDPFALDQVFTFWHPIPPRTGFTNICELPPGHTLTVHREDLFLKRYFQPQFPPADATEKKMPHPECWYQDHLLELLDDAVSIRLRADVPVGAYLSGGFDSAVTAALARRHISDQLKTFSISFEEAEFDERLFQAAMVDHLGVQHHRFVCSNQAIGDHFSDAIWHAERPIIRTAPVPMMLLAKGVREAGIKVVLTGEGADEVLAGYDIFKEAKVRRFWAKNPTSTLRPRLLQRLYPYLSNIKGQGISYLSAFFGKGLDQVMDPFYSHRPRWQVTKQLKMLYASHLRETLKGYDPIDEMAQALPEDFSRWHPLSQAQYLELVYLLPGYILSSQGDRMSMAHGVEGRFPFLDHRVVAFSATIPPNLKLRRLREKHILREATKHLLPNTITNRVKQPYRAPDDVVFFPKKKPLPYVEEALSPSAIETSGLFATVAVEALLHKCNRQEGLGVKDSMALVGTLSTQFLYQQFILKRNTT